MAGIGTFIAGLEDLSLVERLSDRYEMAPRTVIRGAGIVLGIVLVGLLCAGSLFGGWFERGTVELENNDSAPQERSSLKHLSTEFDNDSVAIREATATTDINEATSSQKAVIYVTGAVSNPGLYTLSTGSRVGDAVEAAGGLLPEAATAVVNLAQQLSDGMQIHIPRIDEVSNNAPGYGGSGTVSNAGPATTDSAASSLVNINSADSATLQTLDGVGPATAQKIIDYRMAHGPFQRKEDLMNVSGIGEKKYAALEARIIV